MKVDGVRRMIRGNLKMVLIIALLACIIAVVFVFYPGSGPIKIEDKCGKFVNLFSHTIPDEGQCKVRCKNQCNSIDRGYRKADFESSEKGCNSCLCYCS